MGLFDTVRCEYPLPDPQHQDLEYQTKDFENFLGRYTITRDGRLIRHAQRGRFRAGPYRDIEWPVHGDVRIYTSDAARNWIEYVVRFTHGRVEWIRPLEEARRAPDFRQWDDELPEEPEEAARDAASEPTPEAPPATAIPEAAPSAASPGGPAPEAAPSAEASLLQSLKRDRSELEKLLADCVSHWGYEDPVYRFYHQSFKVYWLQGTTRSIVERLQALAPDRPLHPWFVQIVESGTGKTFDLEDNARWTEITRPILEAFFHARFFLEMAVRYADLEAPPRMLPSGYAALLYLFGLR